jgi:hypothetical protein
MYYKLQIAETFAAALIGFPLASRGAILSEQVATQRVLVGGVRLAEI